MIRNINYIEILKKGFLSSRTINSLCCSQPLLSLRTILLDSAMNSHYIKLSIFCALSALLSSCSSEEAVSTSGTLAFDSPDTGVSIAVLSTKSWLVTGGDALVEVSLDESVNPQPYTVKLNGTDVSARFVSVSGRKRQALLTNLPEGESQLSVEIVSGVAQETLILSNYPSSGPIISGPHEAPFICQSTEFTLVTGEPLGPSTDLNCSVERRIDYVYWSDRDSQFKPYSLLKISESPVDMGYVGEGIKTPFIVRVETGVVNRAIYEISMLHDPADGHLDPWRRSASWNNKLVYTHGGGCRGGWHQQGVVTGGVLNKDLLERGYALSSSTLNVFGQNCNDLLASETHIMLKEVFIEHYGVPTYTVATGVSGGSYQSQQTADNYPGVFDGIIVGLSFPDVTSSTIFTVADARLLDYYFKEVNPEGFTVEQERAVSGFAEHASIANLSRGAARLDPVLTVGGASEEQGSELSVSALKNLRYSTSNPEGLRATVYDHTVNVYGELENTAIAQRPLDNVGVQYGLAALREGKISAQQFIDLNRDIGGFDRDMEHVARRHSADKFASERAIESGRVLFGGAGLRSTPIIDYRSYLDRREGGDIHMIVHQFATRERLINANGHARNQVMQIGGSWGFTEESPDLGALFNSMDSWILAVQQDESDLSESEKVVINKPADLTDACWDNSRSTRVKINQEMSYGGDNECAQLYPAYSTPRQVAGAPVANDVISCRLRGLSAADYLVEFSQEQLAELVSIFAQGVCDWSAPDSHDAFHQGTWLSFGPSPVNRLQ